MAKPPTPDQWIAALRAEGVTRIVEMPGWRSNNRNHKGPWGDVHATMIHHTAGEGPGMPRLVFDGVAGLPGPLCHDFLGRDGTLYLVGNGRANHAGTVARNAYDAVLNESAIHPYPDSAEPIDGNSISYGLEVENSGAVGRTWPAKQYDVAVRVQAARCRMHGWSANSVWAHKEATRRKPVDPRIDMADFRADVAERLRHAASWNPGTTTPSEEDDMPTAKEVAAAVLAEIKANPVVLYDAVMRTDRATPPAGKESKENPTWAMESVAREAAGRAAGAEAVALRVEQKVAQLEQHQLTNDQIAAIATAVAQHPALAEAIADNLAARLKD